MSGEQIWGIIRTILAAGGGWIAAKGWVDAATLEQVLGAVGVLFVTAWSIIAKKKPA